VNARSLTVTPGCVAVTARTCCSSGAGSSSRPSVSLETNINRISWLSCVTRRTTWSCWTARTSRSSRSYRTRRPRRSSCARRTFRTYR